MRKSLALAALVSFVFFSCTPKASEPSNTASKIAADSQSSMHIKTPHDSEFIDFEFHKMIANIPSPIEQIYVLHKSGFTFEANLINPLEHEKKYITSFKQGLNFGVYIVDLMYLETNGEYASAKNYFITCHNIAKKLNAAESLDKVATDRIEKYIENKDTINKVIDAAYTEMDSYLRSNERVYTATQMLLGSWLESQYIMLEQMKNMKPENEHASFLSKKLFEQRSHINSLLSILKEYKNEKELANTLQQFEELNKEYQQITSSDIALPAIAKLADKVSAIRHQITD